jgi:hypothetical protein
VETGDREIAVYSPSDYFKLQEVITEELKNSIRINRYSLRALLQVIQSNACSCAHIRHRVAIFSDLTVYYNLLYTTPHEDLPLYINNHKYGLSIIAKWRLMLNK